MEIFKLFGSILVDNTEANKSISKTGEEAEGLGSKLKNGITTAGKWAAGIATAAIAAGTAMMKAAKDSADALGDIDDAAQRVGVDAETMQELEYVAKMSGMEMSNLEAAAKKLAGTDLNLDEAIDQILSLETAEEQSAKAAELFGEKIAYNLQPLLNHGAEGVQAFKDQAHELGIILSNETVEAGASFGDMLEALSASFSSAKNQLMAEFMPYLMEIMQWIMSSLPEIMELFRSVLDTIIPIVQPVLDVLMEIIPPVFAKIKEFLDWLTPYITPIVEGIRDGVNAIMSLLQGDIDGFFNGIIKMLTGLGKTFYNIGKDLFTYMWEGLKSVWNALAQWIADKVNWLVDKLAFWRRSNDEMKTDGSHASGLNYVPYDGYTAVLHKGESVLSAGNTQSMIQDIINGINNLGSRSSAPIELTLNINGSEFAKATYTDIQNEVKRRGASFAV